MPWNRTVCCSVVWLSGLGLESLSRPRMSAETALLRRSLGLKPRVYFISSFASAMYIGSETGSLAPLAAIGCDA